MNSLKLIKSFNSTAHKQSLIRLNSSTTKVYGEQNTFYFEESNLLKSIPKSDPLYKKLYDKIPVVLVLGWTGCVDNHIYKYKSIYSNLGYHTIRFSPSHSLTILEYPIHHNYSRKLVNLLKNEYNLENNPIITHLLSDASILVVYQHIINEINNQNKEYNFFKLNHKSAVYDSSPGLFTDPVTLFWGICGITKKKIQKTSIRYMFSSILVGLELAINFFLRDNYFLHMVKTIVNDMRNVPTLVMYSKMDKIVSAKSIEDIIKQRKMLNKNLFIKPIAYDCGEHVHLLTTHRIDYVKNKENHLEYCKLDLKTICNFLNICNLNTDERNKLSSVINPDKKSI